ncbi:hypothetical protein B0H34DRAFT_642061, partial [Crassisporium funariophilum]
LIQIRSGHIPLNEHLCRMGKTDSRKCPNCRERRNGRRADETAQHFLFECNKFADSRSELYRELGTNRPQLAKILSDTKGTNSLLKYIARTKRF